MLRTAGIAVVALIAFVSRMAGQEINCYVFIAEECPISIYMADEMRELSSRYGHTANFYAVFPLQSSTEGSAKAFLLQHELLDYRPLIDDEHLLVRRMNATVTPEIIIQNEDQETLYKGRITDAYLSPGRMRHNTTQFNARAALNKLIDGEMPGRPWPKAIGCFISPI